MRPEILLVAQLAVGLVFLQASIGKLRNRRQFLTELLEYDLLPAWLIYPTGLLLIAFEAMVALSHLTGWLIQLMAPATLTLLAVFCALLAVTIKRGLTVHCLCFGAADGQLVSKRTIVRVTALLCLEAVLWFGLRAGDHATSPADFSVGELLLMGLCSALALLVASWLFAIPEVRAVYKPCVTQRVRSD
jgi:hypothetical protein